MYENIIKRSDANFSGTTAISYIANKIRQGDRENSVDIIEVDGTSVLQLKQQVGEEKYHTWIYWKDGSIRELFTDENITLQTLGEGAAGLKLSLRSGGKDANEQK